MFPKSCKTVKNTSTNPFPLPQDRVPMALILPIFPELLVSLMSIQIILNVCVLQSLFSQLLGGKLFYFHTLLIVGLLDLRMWMLMCVKRLSSDYCQPLHWSYHHYYQWGNYCHCCWLPTVAWANSMSS